MIQCARCASSEPELKRAHPTACSSCNWRALRSSPAAGTTAENAAENAQWEAFYRRVVGPDAAQSPTRRLRMLALLLGEEGFPADLSAHDARTCRAELLRLADQLLARSHEL